MTLQLISSVKSLQSVFPSHLREDDLGLLVSLTDLSSPGLQGDAESVIAGELMTGAGGEREDSGEAACSKIQIMPEPELVLNGIRESWRSNSSELSPTSIGEHQPTSTTNGVVADGPLEVSDSQRSEGSLGEGCDVGIGNILHNPDVLLEVVTDNSFLDPNIGNHRVRRILYLVGLIEERIFTETSQCYH